jgi:hypothetical protein
MLPTTLVKSQLFLITYIGPVSGYLLVLGSTFLRIVEKVSTSFVPAFVPFLPIFAVFRTPLLKGIVDE